MTATQGVVSLIGAGPGDPELLTRRAYRRLRAAEVVLHDGLVPWSIVRLARAADRISVARRAGPKAIADAEVISRTIDAVRAGRRTVRLKAGDPFVLGRGHDEVAALTRAGVACELVPGISSATAAPLLAGIPLTARGAASAFVVVSGHAESAFGPVLSSLAPHSATVVVLMGMSERATLRGLLHHAGWKPSTPAAVIVDASRPAQRIWTGVLDELTKLGPAARNRPGVIVVGAVVALSTGATRRPPRPGGTHGNG